MHEGGPREGEQRGDLLVLRPSLTQFVWQEENEGEVIPVRHAREDVGTPHAHAVSQAIQGRAVGRGTGEVVCHEVPAGERREGARKRRKK